MDAELHREENDLYLGHPRIGAGRDSDDPDTYVCECGHTLLFHVHIPSTSSACTHGGCECTEWKEQHDLEDA